MTGRIGVKPGCPYADPSAVTIRGAAGVTICTAGRSALGTIEMLVVLSYVAEFVQSLTRRSLNDYLAFACIRTSRSSATEPSRSRSRRGGTPDRQFERVSYWLGRDSGDCSIPSSSQVAEVRSDQEMIHFTNSASRLARSVSFSGAQAKGSDPIVHNGCSSRR